MSLFFSDLVSSRGWKACATGVCVALAIGVAVAWSTTSAQAFPIICTVGTDTVCINTGLYLTDIDSLSTTGTASTLNSGSVFDNIETHTTSGGSATTTNTATGFVNLDIFTHTDAGGDATTSNAGIVSRSISTVTGFGSGAGGNALTTNSGWADNITTLTFGGGNATTVNSGTIFDLSGSYPFAGIVPLFGGVGQPSMLTATMTGGDASATNSGTVNGVMFTAAGVSSGDGNATAVNSGTVNGVVVVVTGFGAGNGNASFTNNGTINGDVGVFSFGTGNASFVNLGTIYGVFNGVGIVAVDGNATGYNGGRIFSEVDVSAGNNGAAVFTNAGLIDSSNFSGVAIDMTQIDPTATSTLNILPGSRIFGNIILSGHISGTPATTVNLQSGAIFHRC